MRVGSPAQSGDSTWPRLRSSLSVGRATGMRQRPTPAGDAGYTDDGDLFIHDREQDMIVSIFGISLEQPREVVDGERLVESQVAR